ncbi:Ankyrin repeat and KH domain-containing protein mask [Lachnellula hyalina]|uniref:Ankyrin repeat and KH domain-containing protein mask n=1 Tax=Lachnellula hyalina TaxID=1316788 RepID=A0A8H8R2N6_9HELO|nr:Ankyrin repeat and KH domain-containing protein mask [Lachnellula hyalina]TVY25789.1 Ankyrin repeat and KH domain-containing protein mask [Lachnellula hyalina]
MDGLSAAASVVALVQISGQIYNLCQTYYSGVKSAREDIRRLRDEVTSLQDVLNGVADLADSPASAKLAVLDLLNQPNGLVEQCRTELAGLITKLADGQGDGKMKKFGLRALKWPFTKKDVDATISIIERQKALFHLAFTTDVTTLTVAIDQGITQLRHDLAASRVDDQRDKIIKWLSCTDPSSNHFAACKKHQPTTGEWFTKGSNIKEWMETQNSLLWLYGIPRDPMLTIYSGMWEDYPEKFAAYYGAFSSTIIEQMKLHCDKPDSALAYFYFDFSDSEKQKLSNLLSSLLAQLCSKAACLPEQMTEWYKKCGNGQHRASVKELSDALSIMMSEFDDQVFLVIDALDEFARIGERDELLTLLEDIHSWSLPKVHLIVTSRPEPDIDAVLMPLSKPEAISVQGSQVQSDISLHIRSQLAEDPKLKKWPNEVKVDIEKALSARADGIKRDVLLKTLDDLPETLDDTYARILSQIDKNDKMEARRALLWLAFSARPLRIEELAEAAVVDPESDSPFSPENRLLDPHGDILEILGSLVNISAKPAQRGLDDGVSNDIYSDDIYSDDIYSDDIYPDDIYPNDIYPNGRGEDGYNIEYEPEYSYEYEPTEIKLAHFSVRDYLVSERIQASKTAVFSATPVEGNSFIAKSCLLYFFYFAEWAKSTGFVSGVKYNEFPLFFYAYRLWYNHTMSIPASNRMSVDLIAFKLLVSDTASIGLGLLRIGPSFPHRSHRSRPTALYFASGLGLEGGVRMLLELKADINATNNSSGDTALQIAAKRGHEGVVRLLLENNANVEGVGDTALQIAAKRGHEGVVRLLLENNANVEGVGDTALPVAAERGHDGIVRLLLEHNADTEVEDRFGQTALQLAAKKGHEGPMRLLLEHNANVGAKDGVGLTLLYSAAASGHETAVRVLLEHGAGSRQREGLRFDSATRSSSL